MTPEDHSSKGSRYARSKDKKRETEQISFPGPGGPGQPGDFIDLQVWINRIAGSLSEDVHTLSGDVKRIEEVMRSMILDLAIMKQCQGDIEELKQLVTHQRETCLEVQAERRTRAATVERIALDNERKRDNSFQHFKKWGVIIASILAILTFLIGLLLDGQLAAFLEWLAR